jgi:hypothetical protein
MVFCGTWLAAPEGSHMARAPHRGQLSGFLVMQMRPESQERFVSRNTLGCSIYIARQ